MKLFNPMSLWFLTLLIPFVAMYILKRKNEEIIIPSSILWKEAVDNLQASTPWEKLRTNILFFLQLLTLLALIFSLTNPFIQNKFSGYSKNIIVIDNSGSMNYKTKSSNKLEESKLEAIKIVDSLSNKSEVTLIKTSPKSEILVSASKNKSEIKNAIKSIDKSNATASNEEVISLIKSIASNEKSLAYHYFTDENVAIDGVKGKVITFDGTGDNLVLQNLSATPKKDGIDVISTITNSSKENKAVEVSLYGDDKLLQIKEVNVKGEDSYSLQFDKVLNSVLTLKAEIDVDDGLKEDNSLYTIVNQSSKKKVLMVSERNIFFEKALSIRSDIELFKTTNPEEIKSGYDIYIYDGVVPKTLPSDGNFLFSNIPKNNEFISLEDSIEGGSANFSKSMVTEYIEGQAFQLATFLPINLSGNMQSFIEVDDKVAGALGTINNQKVVALSFNIHDSDMPVTHNFPILMNNIANYLSGNNIIKDSDIMCGKDIKISTISNVKNIKVIDSSKNEETFSIENPEIIYKNTINPGIYKVVQKTEDKTFENTFSANFPREESLIKSSVKNENVQIVKNEEAISGFSLMTPLLIGGVIFMILEWIAYIRLNSK